MNDNQDYVRKDIFDAEITRIREAIDNTNKRIDDLKYSVTRSFTVMGIIIGFVGLLLVGVQIGIAILPYVLK